MKLYTKGVLFMSILGIFGSKGFSSPAVVSGDVKVKEVRGERPEFKREYTVRIAENSVSNSVRAYEG